MTSIDDDPIVYAETAKKFEAWLAKNHETATGIWLAIAKKASPKNSVTYLEAVDIALCWGWIDGQKRKLDDDHSLQRFTPRGKRSNWSKTNVNNVARLTRAKRMQPSGLAEVKRAKADGRWEAAYESQAKATVPDDLAAAFKQNPRAAEFFATLNSANRYAFLYRIHTAKKPETRAARIEQFVEMMTEGKTFH